MKARVVAKVMRCSVQSALRLADDDFENAFIAGAAENIARPELMKIWQERERKKRKQNG
jgi:hypothetical protein